jgi:hypothetical protein
MTNAIDCVATDGLTRLPISIGGSVSIAANGNVNIGSSTDYSANTKMYI